MTDQYARAYIADGEEFHNVGEILDLYDLMAADVTGLEYIESDEGRPGVKVHYRKGRNPATDTYWAASWIAGRTNQNDPTHGRAAP
ncbi:MAG TPA: hypothetical protein VIG24_07570 [Acidimicrobiia bacterium]